MKSIRFHYQDTCQISVKELEKIGKQLLPEIKKIGHSLTQGYSTEYAWLNVLTDTLMVDHINAIIAEKKALNPTVMVVIGIGGSNLGAKAIFHAIKGILYCQEQNPTMHIYWADTIDNEYISVITQKVIQALDRNEQVILNVISKSGTTIETVANFHIFLDILIKKRPQDYFKYVVAITDKGSKLWNLCKKQKFSCLEIPKKVNGRFSVFSAAGLFPLGMMLDYSIESLLSGARFIVPECIDESILNNPAAISASILAYQYRQGKNIHDTFLFSPAFQTLGKWYRQLLAESIGKEFNRQNQKVNVGITPTVSIGSTDLHSVVQLYLAGPNDRVTTFVHTEHHSTADSLFVPASNNGDELVEDIHEKSLPEIMSAIEKGVQRAYLKKSLPYMSIIFPSQKFTEGKNIPIVGLPYYIAQFMQFKMLEIVYLGYLLDVNPFDQPQVELYKQETRDILSKKNN